MPNEQPVRPCPECGYPLRASTIICPSCGVAVPYSAPWTVQDYNTRRPRGPRVAGGIVAAQVCALVLIVLGRLIVAWQRGGAVEGIFIAADFTVVPLAMGLISAFCWRKLDLSPGQFFGYTCLNALCGGVVAAVCFYEGFICILMAAPLLIPMVWVGAAVGRRIFAKRNDRLNVSLVPIVLLLIVADARAPHHFASSEADTVVIRATPRQVWRYIPGYPNLNEPYRYWLFNVGLPAPMTATVSARAMNADRKCVFSHGTVFDEKIVEYDPGRRLTFDIVRQPKDPEIVGHLSIDRGQFILRDNGDGTTSVTGTTWYHLNVYPISYFDFWTRDVISHVHLRVMNHIKALAEGGR